MIQSMFFRTFKHLIYGEFKSARVCVNCKAVAREWLGGRSQNLGREVLETWEIAIFENIKGFKKFVPKIH